MTQTDKGQKIQGDDPRGEVFQGLAAVMYAADGPVSGVYIEQSRALAAIADCASGGLRGKTVVDVGCGYGTTTLAVARHAPARIVALDTSAAHLDLFRLIAGNGDIEEYLFAKDAPEMLGHLCRSTLRHLQTMRAELAGGIFRKAGGKIGIIQQSSTTITLEIVGGLADVVVGNNWAHWPLNQLRAERRELGIQESEEENFVNAFRGTFMPIAYVLKHGGIAAVLEPIDFAWDDEDPAWNALQEQQTMSGHPVFIRLHEEINRILWKDHGVERVVPTVARMFPKSRMAALFADCDLTLERTCFFEGTASCDALDAFLVRGPMVLGGVALPFDTKAAILDEAAKRVRAALSAETLALPVRGEYTIYVLRRR